MAKFSSLLLSTFMLSVQAQSDSGKSYTWSSDLVWDTNSGVSFKKASNWGKKFKSNSQNPVGLPTTLSATMDADGVSVFMIEATVGWPIKWEDKSSSESKAITANLAWSMLESYQDSAQSNFAEITAWETSVLQLTRTN